MITKQTIRENIVIEGIENNDMIGVNHKKLCDYIDSQIQSLLEQIIPEKANERNTGKISQTEILSYEQSSGWNLCLEELKSRIINSGFEVK